MNHYLELQAKLQRKIGMNLTTIESIKLNFIGLITEAAEMIEETPWKIWKKSGKYSRQRFKEELIDVLFFWLNLALAAGFTSEEIKQMYDEKFLINMERQEHGY